MCCPLDKDIALIGPNIIEFSNSADSVNPFAINNKSNAVSFTYTAIDGTQKDSEFPLTGFIENRPVFRPHYSVFRFVFLD